MSYRLYVAERVIRPTATRVVVLAASCLIAPFVFAAKPPPLPPPPLPVTSTVHDADAAGNMFLFRGDDINGVQGVYTNIGKVATGVGNPGGWGLNLYNQVARTVCLTFSPLNGAPAIQNGCYSANVEIYSHCHDLSNNEIGLLTFPALHSETNCLFAFDVTVGRTKYKMAMGQYFPTGGPTGLAKVTCNANNGTTCISWTIEPNADAPNPRIANLYSFGHRSLDYIGQYSLTFLITATLP